MPVRRLIGVHDSRNLRYTDSGYDSGRTDRTGTDSYLDTVRACPDQGLRPFRSSNIAGDYLQIRELLLDHADYPEHVGRMPMGAVHNDNVNMRLHQFSNAVKHIHGHAHACTRKKPSLYIFCGVWIFDIFLDILDRDQALQMSCFIHDRELFLSRPAQNPLRLLQRDSFMGGDKIFGGHIL